MNIYIQRLESIFILNNVCSSHGIEHAIAVMNNAKKALKKSNFNLDKNIKKCILLAALLHDADDRKFFPNNFNYENVKEILDDIDHNSLELIIKMISLVSSSNNGDNIPNDIDEWMLYPRYADRLEAIGLIGIKRCYQYAITVNNLLYTNKTPFTTTEEELWEIATIERYNNYKGTSESMIDHYYDKLLRACDFPIRNIYFDEECKKRKQTSIDFVIMFGLNNGYTHEEVNEFINLYEKIK
jgi:uncharacterized protein